jgi:hypothetical protein
LVKTLKNVVDPGREVYLLVTVQLTRPPLAVPEHPEEYVAAYPEIAEELQYILVKTFSSQFS